MKNKLQKLNERLSLRFETAKKSVSDLSNKIEKSSSNGSNSSSVDAALSLPETPPEEPIVEEPEKISCMQLYKLMKSANNNILLIDVRPQNDYTNSHIQNNNCIHIPPENIKKG